MLLPYLLLNQKVEACFAVRLLSFVVMIDCRFAVDGPVKGSVSTSVGRYIAVLVGDRMESPKAV